MEPESFTPKDKKSQVLAKSRQELKAMESKLREQTMGYVTAAFGLIAGLAWNDAVKTLIEQVFTLKGNTILAKFIYALVLTIILVLVSVYLNKLVKGSDQQ